MLLQSTYETIYFKHCQEHLGYIFRFSSFLSVTHLLFFLNNQPVSKLSEAISVVEDMYTRHPSVPEADQLNCLADRTFYYLYHQN